MKNDKWISELETGILELDRENRTLMALIDGAIAAGEAADTADLRRAMTKLQDQAKIDFAREDRLMDALRYQGAAQHQAGHQQLLAEIQHHIDGISAGQVHTYAIPSAIPAELAYATRFNRGYIAWPSHPEPQGNP